MKTLQQYITEHQEPLNEGLLDWLSDLFKSIKNLFKSKKPYKLRIPETDTDDKIQVEYTGAQDKDFKKLIKKFQYAKEKYDNGGEMYNGEYVSWMIFSSKKNICVVCLDNKKRLGCIKIFEVLEKGDGFGSKCLQKYIDIAKTNKVEKITLISLNQLATDFYAKNGFEITKEYPLHDGTESRK